MPKLKDTFSRILFFMEEKGTANVPFRIGISEAAEEIKEEVAKLKKASACIPPCGFQINARYYICTSCSFEDCQLPIDCPSTFSLVLPVIFFLSKVT
nr:sperm acrosome membrane-associated protein 6 [Anolis sagrei ordinatus]